MKKLVFTGLVFIMMLVLGGCIYDWVVPEDIIDPNDPNAEEVSFSQDILPIFANNCVSCHDGSPGPDLRAENAFSALNNTRYINKATPEESRIYTVPHPDIAGHSQKKYTASQANFVLLWITQGAANN